MLEIYASIKLCDSCNSRHFSPMFIMNDTLLSTQLLAASPVPAPLVLGKGFKLLKSAMICHTWTQMGGATIEVVWLRLAHYKSMHACNE